MLKEKRSTLKSETLASLKNFNDLFTADSVVGTPITTNETTIIPIAKITVGTIGGSGEYGEVKLFSKEKNYPFAGGNGSIINVNPSGFLVCKKSDVTFIKADDDLAEVVFQKTSDFISKTLVQNNEK